MRRTMKRILACVLALAMMLGVLPAVSAAEPPTGTVVLADSNGAAPIYIDRDGADYDGLSLISMAVAEDFGAITGQSSKVCAVATAAEAKTRSSSRASRTMLWIKSVPRASSSSPAPSRTS